MDQGCGKPEDLVAMMSIADGILRMETKADSRTINVIKYPKLPPTRIEIPIADEPTIKSAFDTFRALMGPNAEVMRRWMQSMSGQDPAAMRKEVGDFVNLFWPQFVRWSAMLWDPRGFPTMIYELNREDGLFSMSEAMRRFLPWRAKLLVSFILLSQALRLFPGHFSRVPEMKRMGDGPYDIGAKWERSGSIEYLDGVSKTDEHHFRVHGNADCWGLENVGAALLRVQDGAR